MNRKQKIAAFETLESMHKESILLQLMCIIPAILVICFGTYAAIVAKFPFNLEFAAFTIWMGYLIVRNIQTWFEIKSNYKKIISELEKS